MRTCRTCKNRAPFLLLALTLAAFALQQVSAGEAASGPGGGGYTDPNALCTGISYAASSSTITFRVLTTARWGDYYTVTGTFTFSPGLDSLGWLAERVSPTRMDVWCSRATCGPSSRDVRFTHPNKRFTVENRLGASMKVDPRTCSATTTTLCATLCPTNVVGTSRMCVDIGTPALTGQGGVPSSAILKSMASHTYDITCKCCRW
jgi:hypothetical protein